MDEVRELTRLFRETMSLFRETMSLFKSNMAKCFGGIEITAPQGMVIRTLEEYGEMKISDLSEKLGLTNSTVSGIVDRLEKAGLVERTRSLEDKRVVNVRLSGRFEEIHKDFRKRIDDKILNFLKRGTPDDLKKIAEALRILKRMLSDNGNRQ